jgi:formate hydrogenlyase transcriptional activator
MQPDPQRHFITENFLDIDESSRRYRALLHAADLAARRAFPELLQDLSLLLHELFEFNFLNYALWDDSANVMRLYMLDEAVSPPGQLEFSVDESPAGWGWSNQQPLIISDLRLEGRFRHLLDLYSQKGIRSLMVLPMTTARRRLGTLSFGSTQTLHCDSDVVRFLERLSSLVALALENSLFLKISRLGNATAAEAEEQRIRGLASALLGFSESSTHGYESLRNEREGLQVVVEILGAMAASRLDLRQMFPAISKSLQQAVSHDALAAMVLDNDERYYNVYAVEPSSDGLGCLQGTKIKRDETLSDLVRERARDGEVIRFAEFKAYASRFATVQQALDAGLVTWCLIPMRTPERFVGMFCVGSRKENAFDRCQLELLRQLAAAMAFFIESAQLRSVVESDKCRLQKLLEISCTLTTTLDWTKLTQQISAFVRRLTAQDYAELGLYEATTDLMQLHVLHVPEGQAAPSAETNVPVMECPTGIAFRAGEMKVITRPELEHIGSGSSKAILARGIHAIYCVPLISRGKPIGSLGVGSTRTDAFDIDELELLQQVAPQIASAVDNSRAYDEVTSLKDRLVKETVYLEEEILETLNFEDIVGRSPSLTDVLEQVKTVAPSTATVLILGETGTGKELVARAIHRLSSRSPASFVKLNCAAIPTGLLESELFGHEKGAFTGAISQKVGRLELADKGTLFLDEVGEIPSELQPKLLRVLQDQEFERLGSNRTIRVNVRVLAATNRDLAKAVNDHEFRADLYYRLHVFPVRLPSLHDRVEDIPLLVQYFVQKFARRMNKRITSIPAEAMQALQHWSWPGNIRELENFIERSVILSEGQELRVPVGELLASPDQEPDQPGFAKPASLRLRGTLEELEREYILQVLRQSGGVIAGSHGAAARLGMKRTTLQSKILRLHIKGDEYRC